MEMRSRAPAGPEASDEESALRPQPPSPVSSNRVGLLVMGGLLVVLVGVVLVREQERCDTDAPTSTTNSFRATIDPNPSASSLDGVCQQAAREATAIVDALKALHTPSKQAVVALLNDVDAVVSNALNWAQLLESVSPSEAVRTTASSCFVSVSSMATGFSLDTALYNILESVRNDTPTNALLQRRYERAMTSFQRSGVALPDAASRALAQSLSTNLTILSSQFETNLAHDTRALNVSSGSALLEGLGAEFLEPRTKDGIVTLTTNYPDYIPVLTYARSRELRRRMYVLAHQRGMPNNVPILETVLAKRLELAHMLGYASWADFAAETMMIGSAAAIDVFTRNVSDLTVAQSEVEMQRALQVLQDDGAQCDPCERVEAYDVSFCFEKIREASYSVDNEEVSRFFSYFPVRDGVLAAAERLFGVTFRKVEKRAWHEHVDVYDVYWAWAPSNSIGRFYLDMFPRVDKYKHAAQFPIRNGIDGVQLPEGALVCNFPREGNMEHGQVQTFFHEFGHLMHHILGGQDQRWVEFSGVATEWDFVEAPSQMLEEWMYDLTTLQRFAVDPVTGEPIPAELVEKLKVARTFGRATNARQQMFYAQLSLQLHQPPSGVTAVNSTQVLLDLQEQFSPYPYVPGTFFQANFGHLMGYSSNYYTYMWSMAIAQHMFGQFTQAPGGLDDVATSIRYRDTVIGQGGKKDALKLVYDFVGREFDLTALHAYLSAQ